MTFSLRIFCYFTILMLFLNIPAAFSSKRCQGDFEKQEEELRAHFLHFSRYGTETFRELITKHRNDGRHYLFLLSRYSAAKKSSIIESMDIQEIKLLPEPIKKALVYRPRPYHGNPAPLFRVNLTKHFNKVAYLLSYMEGEQISTGQPFLRKRIIQNLDPEDKENLSDFQLISLKKGIRLD